MVTFAALIYLFIFEYCLLEIPLYVDVLQHHCRMPDFLSELSAQYCAKVSSYSSFVYILVGNGEKTFADTFKYSI